MKFCVSEMPALIVAGFILVYLRVLYIVLSSCRHDTFKRMEEGYFEELREQEDEDLRKLEAQQKSLSYLEECRSTLSFSANILVRLMSNPQTLSVVMITNTVKARVTNP